MKRWYAQDKDFETESKTLVLEKPLNACSLFCNISVGLSLLEKTPISESLLRMRKINVEVKLIEDYIQIAILLLVVLMRKIFLTKLLRLTKKQGANFY